MASGEGYLDRHVILHEISHGLGPAYARTATGKVDIREAIGAAIFRRLKKRKRTSSAKWASQWLVDHGALPKEKLNAVYASYVAGDFPHGPLRNRRSARRSAR